MLLPLQCWGYKTTPLYLAFCFKAGDQTQILMCSRQALYQVSHFCIPLALFLFNAYNCCLLATEARLLGEVVL